MSIAELRLPSKCEKLKIVETRWAELSADLSADEAAVESPDWRADELRKPAANFTAGRVTSVVCAKQAPTYRFC
jgi:hypothetical protein